VSEERAGKQSVKFTCIEFSDFGDIYSYALLRKIAITRHASLI